MLYIEINIAYGPGSFLDLYMKIIFLFVLAFVVFNGKVFCERKIM
jgi:hypothetical protein